MAVFKSHDLDNMHQSYDHDIEKIYHNNFSFGKKKLWLGFFICFLEETTDFLLAVYM